jgi:hypothetical protein
MRNHSTTAFLMTPSRDGGQAVPARENLERRTTSREFKNQMVRIATSGHFSAEERLKAFSAANSKRKQS